MLLYIESHHDATTPEKKEVDFFSEHTQDAADDFSSYPVEDNARLGGNSLTSQAKPIVRNGKQEEDPGVGPNVEAALSTSPTQALSQADQRKTIIGTKKPAAAKKGKGLGAQRVQKDFGAIESRAQQVDKEREELAKNIAVEEAKTKEEQEKQIANMKLAYQDMSLQRKKEEDRLMKNDPKKAEQFERLGMGFAGNKGVSHSALSDMHVINQEAPKSSTSSSRRDFDTYGEKPRNRRDFFDDEFEMVSSWSSKRTDDSSSSKNDDFGSWGSKNKSGGWDIDKFDDKSNTSETISQKNTDSYAYNDDKENEGDGENIFVNDTWSSRSRKNQDSTSQSTNDSSDTAQKKFGAAKAISSDQFFGNKDNDFETRQNLSRLEGQTSISSDDFFGGSGSSGSSSRRQYSSATPDLQDIKDGVRQGVTKVAGKLSSLANGVMSSLQDRYG
ncbi:ADP-ribosylation factor GTPase-activating protein 2 [Bulinus truncatus]|nr:ADP-ribosylation factor GTPase-activating protein 2 [Bulinus truncatus]